ncbi:MAG: hypothetical protein ACP5QO_02040 [Clostridia bacterium]
MGGDIAWNPPPMAVLAGDSRSEALVRQLRADGNQARLVEVTAPGLVPSATEWLVIPPSGTVPRPALTLIANASRGVLAPRRAPWMADLAVPVVTYGDDPTFVWENARLTGEGALAWALSRTTQTLRGAHPVVYGFGRVGLAAAYYLGAVGCRVHVVSRNDNERGAAGVLGHIPHRLGALPPDITLVINTIPAPVIDEEEAAQFGGNTPVLDLASDPGGFSQRARRLLGDRLERRPGLPGLAVPETAARVLREALVRVLRT